MSDVAPAADSPSPQPGLAALRGLRTAPALDAPSREALRLELAGAMGPCAWFTIGVMAPSATSALAALRLWEGALGWPALQLQEMPGTPGEGPESTGAGADPAGSVFLKGNQRTGTYLLRHEAGLGEGILISGHHPDNPAVEDTWGPLPLNLFAQVDA